MQIAPEIAELLDHESIENDAPHTHAAWQAGDVAHQGDVIFVGLKSKPRGCKKRLNHQLAEGDTQGSRHILAPGPKLYDASAESVAAAIKAACGLEVQARYCGPLFTTPAEVTHPEHGNHIWPEKGLIAVVYQRNLDAEENEQRVRD